VPLSKEQMSREKKVISVSQVHDSLGKDWMVKVIVVHKNHPRTWKNAKGTGRVLNFEVADFHNKNREQFEDGEVI